MQQDTSPALKAFAITPNDTTGMSLPVRALYIGAGGNLVVIPIGQTTSVAFVGVQAGTVLPIAAKLVLATGTTATSIVGLV